MTSRSNNAPQPTAAAAEIAQPNSAVRAASLPLDLSRAARDARAACGKTQAQLALDLHTRPQLVAAQEHPQEPHAPTIRHIAEGPAPYRMSLLRDLAALDGACVVGPVLVQHQSHLARNAALIAELTDVLVAYSRDIADGKLDDAAHIEQQALEAIDALRELIASAREARGAR